MSSLFQPPTKNASIPVSPLENSVTSSAGMGTQVVRGSLWSIGGQAVILIASLLATPIIIRTLGTQVYGVWGLINTILGTLAFADAGMNTASTKWTSEAFARGQTQRERQVVWTSWWLSLLPTSLFALSCAWGAPWLVRNFFSELPASQFDAVVLALRLASLGFVLRSASHIFNSPILARLRLDLNQLIMCTPMLLQIALVPWALYQGGVVAGALLLVGSAISSSVAQIVVASRFVPECWKPTFAPDLVRPLVRFGGPAVVSTLVVQILTSSERLLLGRFVSIVAAGYFNAALTAAGVMSVLPIALSQALLPAFSRQIANEDNDALQELVTRTMRGVLFLVLPLAALMCAVGRPFFALWAGTEIADNSTVAFYFLILSMVLNVIAFVPTTLMTARGFTVFAAKYSLFEFVPYLVCAALMTIKFGIAGAALARVMRFIFACLISIPIAQKKCGISFSPGLQNVVAFALALIFLCVPLGALALPTFHAGWMLLVALSGIILYAIVMHKKVLNQSEKQWMNTQSARLRKRG